MAGDEVVPFRARGRDNRRTTRQFAADRDRYWSAAARQKADALIATGRVVPARITMALDMRGLYGPAVDLACGTQEPYVDLWECGLEVPTPEQVQLLAKLTGLPPEWFYMPIEAGPLLGGSVFICGPRKCEVVASHVIDERGVLHHNGVPREPPAGWQGHLF